MPAYKSAAIGALLRRSKRLLTTPALVVRRAVQTQHAYATHPPVLVNSLPKSGTHLVLQIAAALPATRHMGRFIAQSPSVTQKLRPPKTIARKLRALLPGEAIGAHIYHDAEVQEAIRGQNILHLFVYRDPRDVVMSEMHYLTEMNRFHRMHRHFRAEPDFAARFELALSGFDARYPEANARLLPYAGWCGAAGVCAVRYEDLTGAGQDQALQQITDAWGRCAGKDHAQLVSTDALKAAIAPEKSHTFRRGGSGAWRRDLTAEQIQRLNTALAPSLRAFGYAADPGSV